LDPSQSAGCGSEQTLATRERGPTEAFSLNDAGQIVGQYDTASGIHGIATSQDLILTMSAHS
jgi:hypothetical protein